MSTVALIATLMGGAVSAQALRDARPPAEFPPASFTGNQYVDSRGCVYVRAGIGNATDWVPRVSRTRDQLCGFQPTPVRGSTTAQRRANVPNPLDTRVAGLPPRTAAPAPTPAPAQAAARPAPAPVAPTPVRAPQPTRTLPPPTVSNTSNRVINPLTGQVIGAAPRPTVQRPAPTVQRPAQTAQRPAPTVSPSPRVIATPAPAPQPRVLTRAQACEGLTGIQTNLISQRTGQPIDCGGAPAPRVVAAQTRPIVQAPLPTPTRTQVAPRVTPQVAPQQGLSRANACADLSATGRQYVSTTTGLPIRCGPQTQRINPARVGLGQVATAPRATVVPQTIISAPRVTRASTGTVIAPTTTARLATSCGPSVAGLPVRCSPQALAPSSGTSPTTVRRARAGILSGDFLSEGVIGDLLNQDPPPYSNPRGVVTRPTRPAGYSHVWNDGRLNTQRGLPRAATSTIVAPSAVSTPSSRVVRYATAPRATAPTTQTARLSTRVAPQPTQRSEQGNGHRFVQVGTYSTRLQAQDIAQSLRARGMPMRINVFNQNGRERRTVLAGPFASEGQAQSALRTMRSIGFTGAFTRR